MADYFEKGLLVFLGAQTVITDIVGTRFFGVEAHQSTAAPYLIFQRISGVRDLTHGRTSKLVRSRFQFDCYAETYDVAKSLGAAVRTALHDYNGAMGTYNVSGVHVVNEQDVREEQAKLFRTIIDVVLWHNET